MSSWDDTPDRDLAADLLASAKLALENCGTQLYPVCPPHQGMLSMRVLNGATLTRCIVCGTMFCINCGSDKIDVCKGER